MLSPRQRAELDAIFSSLAQFSKIVLAVSGGSDSMAMMGMAAIWRANHPSTGPDFITATVDHGLRSESFAEVKLVERAAQKLHFPHAILPWRGVKPKRAIQERARYARYALLARYALEQGCDAVAVAHHADDQVETLLMRILRGSGPAGLSGMAPVAPLPVQGVDADVFQSIKLVRPLLSVTKSHLKEWLSSLELEACEDRSNEDLRFRRPQLRARRELFEREGFGVVAAARLAQRARRAEYALNEAFLDWRSHLAIKTDERSWRISKDAARAPEEFLVRFLRTAAAELGGRPARLERVERLALALIAALERDAPFSATVGGLHVFLSQTDLVLERENRQYQPR